jgi:hypothetical protein
MRRNSLLFECGFGLAVSAFAPTVIGIQFVFTSPAVADDAPPDPYAENPCQSPASFQECLFHTHWLQMHQSFWHQVWNQSYQHGHSFMSAEPPAAPDSNNWTLKVWLDAGLDYFDPHLTLQAVEDQLVTEGQFDLASCLFLIDMDDSFFDSQAGVLVTRNVAFWSVSGVVTGSTQMAQPVAAALVRTMVADSLGHEATVYHLFLAQLEATLAAAMSDAQDFHDAVVAGGLRHVEQPVHVVGLGDIATANPAMLSGAESSVSGESSGGAGRGGTSGADVYVDCPFGGVLTPECCWCNAVKQVDYGGCDGVFWSMFGACLPNWQAALALVSCTACAWMITRLAWADPPGGLPALIIVCGTCLGSAVYAYFRCYSQAHGAELQCQAQADRNWLTCLHDHGCPIPGQ